MYRLIVSAALLGGVGLGAWSSFSTPLKPPGLDFGALASRLQEYLGDPPAAEDAAVSAILTKQPHVENEPAILLNAALSSDTMHDLAAAPRDDLPARQATEESCGAWSVSEAGMEAILEEMIRHGWTPPARSNAIAFFQPADRSATSAPGPGSLAFPGVQKTDDGDSGREPSGFTN